jgi:hypothetical protein
MHMRWKVASVATVLSTLVALGAARDTDAHGNRTGVPDDPMVEYYLKDPEGGSLPDAQVAKTGAAKGVVALGQVGFGGGGFNADVNVHRHANGRYYAYVGQWGYGSGSHCDAANRRGVKVVDVTDPSSPAHVATLQNPLGTSAEDVQALTWNGRDVLMTGIQSCVDSSDVRRGLQLFDVTDLDKGRQPTEVGFLDTGRGAGGVHEFRAAIRRDGRVIAVLTVPYSDSSDIPVPAPTGPYRKRGDIRIADISDPANPVELADWGLRNDAEYAKATDEQIEAAQFRTGLGCYPRRFGHAADISDDVRTAYVSYWDWGFKLLDISDPTRPRLVSSTTYPANVDGDGHSSDLMRLGNRTLMLTGDEDYPTPGYCIAPAKGLEGGWGYLRMFDVTNPNTPKELGTFKTPNSAETQRRRKGDYTVHNPFVVGTKAYVSWYGDGLRVLQFDAANPGTPTEVGYFVPKAARDPQHLLPFAPVVWGVVVDDRGVIYLSDMNSGLWILKEE